TKMEIRLQMEGILRPIRADLPGSRHIWNNSEIVISGHQVPKNEIEHSGRVDIRRVRGVNNQIIEAGRVGERPDKSLIGSQTWSIGIISRAAGEEQGQQDHRAKPYQARPGERLGNPWHLRFLLSKRTSLLSNARMLVILAAYDNERCADCQ